MHWNRRAFLKAAGIGAGLSALAPFLPLPRAEALPGPKRLVLVTNGQGSDMTRWRPTGTETDFALGYCLEPLARHQDRLIVLDGVDNEACYHSVPGTDFVIGGHFGMSTLWTGLPIPPGTVRSEGCGWPQGPSVDRIIAAANSAGTRFDAFYWGTWSATLASGRNQGPNGIAYHRGPDQPIDVEAAPDRAFDRLFEGVSGNVEEIARLRAERRSVIDLVNGEITRLRPQLPRVDRDRLDAHLHGIRTMEERLTGLVGTCTVPGRPMTYTERDTANDDLIPLTTRLQFELMAHALACDLTRVACFQWPHSEGNAMYLGSEGYRSFGSIHTAAHNMSYELVDDMPVSDEARVIARQDMANLTRWYAQKISDDLLGVMLPDVLDNTLLVWASEMSEGGTHSNRNIPVVIYQGRELTSFRTNRWLRWGSYDPLTNYSRSTGGPPMNKVLVSLCHAMGLPEVSSVGDASLGTGPLEELA